VDPSVEASLHALARRGWTITVEPEADVHRAALPAVIADRYPAVPEAVRELVACVTDAVSPSGKAWLLCGSDYEGRPGSAFRWDEFERQSLAEAADDPDWTRKIRAHWNRYLPIMLSVLNCYSYFAVDLKTGAVVHGEEPEYEEVTRVADTFEQFMALLADGTHDLVARYAD
jgi:hypothetical protein